MFAPFVNYPVLGIAAAFVVGALAGSFLNVCICRIPLQKSLIWPGSRCGHCYQRIPWYHNLPLISYWSLKGKCCRCGVPFSSRYFWIELFTASSFALLFWLEATSVNLRGVETGQAFTPVRQPGTLVVIWIYHAVFLSFLIVAGMTDAEHWEIPLRVTIPGTVFGVLGGMLAPWPWPGVLNIPVSQLQSEFFGGMGVSADKFYNLAAGLQSWPVWMPPWEWMPPGSWQMGLATSLVGALAGTMVIRGIRLVFGWAFGKEAMGLGDADLMMMIGAYLGWQDVFLVLILAVFLGLFYVLLIILQNKSNEMKFGPFLAGGAALAMIFPHWPLVGLHGFTQWLFFDHALIVVLLLFFAAMSFVVSMVIRMGNLVIAAFSQGKRVS